jgi:hypothetical protein
MTDSFDPERPGVYSPQGGATTIKFEDDALNGPDFGCFNNHVGDGSSNYSYYAVLFAQ